MTAPDPDEIARALAALRVYDTTALGTVSAAGPHVAGVFFAPEVVAGGITLVLAMLEGSRKLEEIGADPRVAFMCSPGSPARWIQGAGLATISEAAVPERDEMFARLVHHAPGARQFVDRLPVRPVRIRVRSLTVVEPPAPTLRLSLG